MGLGDDPGITGPDKERRRREAMSSVWSVRPLRGQRDFLQRLSHRGRLGKRTVPPPPKGTVQGSSSRAGDGGAKGGMGVALTTPGPVGISPWVWTKGPTWPLSIALLGPQRMEAVAAFGTVYPVLRHSW